ncbi:DUF4238 domain-containing protein [Flammeovirga sp. MY04]|uniref:DUF4238 domain-containing protein n=1 Tax=Flammeovirga sp. MY04 TaxID=1191459 RepID=UPI0008063B9C|nr:DUF4238 domain-containing protein [Flammeovirga sp. MY04]ANQ51155.1 DUF4238 domain-containing protein [Flammeovirga sp. MY04]
MNNVKKQHFVPRVYLRKFTNRNKRIFVYDKEKKDVYSSSVDNVAFHKFFYDNPDNKQDTEKSLGKIESSFGQILINLFDKLKFKHNVLKLNEKKIMFEFVFIQMIRTTSFRKRLPSQHKVLVQALKEKVNIDLSDPDFDAKQTQKSLILSDNLQEILSSVFDDKIFLFWKNNTDIPFLSSDNPSIGIFNDNSIVDNKYEIYMPLSPYYSLSIVSKRSYPELLELDNSVLEVNPENVKHYNYQIIKKSVRHIFSNNRDFHTIQNLFQKYPDGRFLLSSI